MEKQAPRGLGSHRLKVVELGSDLFECLATAFERGEGRKLDRQSQKKLPPMRQVSKGSGHVSGTWQKRWQRLGDP